MNKTLESLKWYAEGRGNHGRGRICGDDSKLLKAGYLSLRWLSRFDWVLTITEKGKRALETI